MGVDTKGLLLGKIELEEIANLIQHKFNADVKIDKSSSSSSDEMFSGFIHFNYKGENRSLHWFFSTSQHDIKQCTEVDQNNIYTQISLGMWGSSIEIIKLIVEYFEGYIDENDCDDEGYKPIIKNINGLIKPIIRVKMQDIYDKFGGIVIIEDK